MGHGETGNQVPRREAVEGRAEKAGQEMDSTALGEQERDAAEQAFNAILQLGIDYKERNPDNAKKLGSEKMLTMLTEFTFKTLEKEGIPLSLEQKNAVKEMVVVFLSKVKDGQGTAKIDLNQKDLAQKEVTQSVQSGAAIGGEQSRMPEEQVTNVDLSVVKDGFEYMEALGTLQGQLSGDKEHDKPIKEQMTALNIANLLYEFNKERKEPNLNGQVRVGNSSIQLTSSGDTITANVDNQFTFQYSRASIKKQLGI